MSGFVGKTIILGVTGGIAAYKAAAIASLLVQADARVEVIMTEGARRFMQPLTFSAITRSAVHVDPFVPWSESFSGHVGLAETADLLLIAPATAAAIARLALGLADDLLGLVALSSEAPILIAPAMEDRMFRHPSTQQHLTTLAERGAEVIGPERGRLASGAIGQGRMAEPEAIVRSAANIFSRNGFLRGFRLVVTAGGTREPLDPVRYIGNRSSGRMGYALVEAAVAAGAHVTLVTGPVSLEPPRGATVVRVETAAEMQTAVEHATRDADLLFMAAAVADFRPETAHQHKIKKESGVQHRDLRLIRNPDILASIERPGLIKVGFAAETKDLLANATSKLHAKRLAMIVANDAETTIDAEDSAATILTADGFARSLPRMSKQALAAAIVHIAAALLPDTERRER